MLFAVIQYGICCVTNYDVGGWTLGSIKKDQVCWGRIKYGKGVVELVGPPGIAIIGLVAQLELSAPAVDVDGPGSSPHDLFAGVEMETDARTGGSVKGTG